jgi:hypothetical protein
MVARKSPGRKTPTRSKSASPVRAAEHLLAEVDYKPTKMVFQFMHWTGLTLLMLGLAAAFAWVYYISKAVDNDTIGGNDGNGTNSHKSGTARETRQKDTIDAMFHATIVSILLYYVARHHYSKLHY